MIDIFEKLFPNILYHSYVVEGDPLHTANFLKQFLENRGEIDKNSVDLLLNFYDSFSISDIKTIKEWHQNKPIENKKKICIIGAKFINHEAEQALLKIIEEPNSYTHFFIIIPDSSLLLDTLLSRVHLIKDNRINKTEDNNFAQEFLKSSPSVRIEKVSEIIKEFKDEDGSGGLRYKAISIINSLESVIYKEWKENIKDSNKIFLLEELKKKSKFPKYSRCFSKNDFGTYSIDCLVKIIILV